LFNYLVGPTIGDTSYIENSPRTVAYGLAPAVLTAVWYAWRCFPISIVRHFPCRIPSRPPWCLANCGAILGMVSIHGRIMGSFWELDLGCLIGP